MSNDTITIDLPVCGKQATIRAYTTHGDDKQAQAILYKGLTATADASGKQNFSVSMDATAAADAKYVELLVERIGDDAATPAILDSLRSEDYEAVLAEVRRITSPKASKRT